jgi:polyphenol oxidase
MLGIDEASRREFLQQVGIGVIGSWGMGGVALASHTQGPCDPPAHGAAVPFRRDCRPIRPRQIADTLTSAEVTELKAAYKAMRDLDTSDPADPRGFRQQANVHCFNCATVDATIQVHGSWKFFAWHRAYLYFHERILGKLIGNENFRLPFWGWDAAPYHKLPGPYVTPNNATNPLYNGTRGLAPGTALPDEDVGATVISDVLALGSFDEFGGSASGSGVPEGSPHGSVHIDVSGDMGAFSTAGRDPVFYQHHATVDKLWSDWNKASSLHTNPTVAAFRNLTFTFFDENKVWRSITAGQVVEHEHSLRYVYEPYRFWDRFLCLIWRPVTIDWKTTGKIVIPKTSLLVKALGGDTPVRLHIRGLRVPTDRSTVYRIYASDAEAKTDRGPKSPGYLGNVGVVLNDPDNKHPIRGVVNAILSLNPTVRASLARGDALQPYLVDRNEKAAQKRPIPVRAADIFFSVGQMDREK